MKQKYNKSGQSVEYVFVNRVNRYGCSKSSSVQSLGTKVTIDRRYFRTLGFLSNDTHTYIHTRDLRHEAFP